MLQENASPASPLGGAAADFGSSPRSQLGGDVGGGAAANEPASGFGRSPRGQLAGGAASGLTGGASDHQGGLLGGLLAGFPLPGPRPLGFEPYEDEELHGETAGPEPGDGARAPAPALAAQPRLFPLRRPWAGPSLPERLPLPLSLGGAP